MIKSDLAGKEQRFEEVHVDKRGETADDGQNFDPAIEDQPDIGMKWPAQLESNVNQVDNDCSNLGMSYLNFLNDVPGYGNPPRASKQEHVEDLSSSADVISISSRASSPEVDSIRYRELEDRVRQQETWAKFKADGLDPSITSSCVPTHNRFRYPLKKIFICPKMEETGGEAKAIEELGPSFAELDAMRQRLVETREADRKIDYSRLSSEYDGVFPYSSRFL